MRHWIWRQSRKVEKAAEKPSEHFDPTRSRPSRHDRAVLMWRSTWHVLSTGALWHGRAGASAAKAAPSLRRRAHSAASARFLATLAKPSATTTAVAEPALEEVEEEFQNDDVGAAGRKGSRGPTPAIRQYLAIKHNYPYHILMFRLGDFYEMFFEDAMRYVLVPRTRHTNCWLTLRHHQCGVCAQHRSHKARICGKRDPDGRHPGSRRRDVH